MSGDQRVAVVTGANKGIGRETARQLLGRGWKVFVAARDPEKGRQAVDELQSAGGTAAVLPLDVADGASIAAAAEEFGRQSQQLDVLINNAGLYEDRGVSILTVSREALVHTFQTNTFGPVAVAQAFVPYLRRSASARIINVSSGYGQLDGMSPDVPAYCLSKPTLNGVTLLLAEALRQDGIAVNSMCPGWVKTEMGGQEAPRSVAEGADTAVWLAAEAPQSATGQFFRDRAEIAW